MKNTINLDKIMDDKRFDDNTSRVFGHCVSMSAVAGGFRTSIQKIAKFLGLTSAKVRTSLSMLEDENEIELKASPKYTYVVVLNLNRYVFIPSIEITGNNELDNPNGTIEVIDRSKTYRNFYGFGLICLECWDLKEADEKKSLEKSING